MKRMQTVGDSTAEPRREAQDGIARTVARVLGCSLLLLPMLLLATVARAADRDGDGFDDLIDVCPFVFDDQSDVGGVGVGSAPDGVGDACQCGDVDDDGVVTPADGDLLSDAALGLDPDYTLSGLPGFVKCDVGGTEGCSGLDGAIVTRATLGLAPAIAQVCSAATFTPTNNLSLGSSPVSIVGLSDLVIGHANVLSVQLQAEEATSNVAVQFFIVDQAAYDAAGEDDDIPQFLIGSTILETVNSGASVVEVEVVIPSEDLDGNPIAAGQYYLYPVLDPGQELTETDEDDNVPGEGDFASVGVTDAYVNANALIVEQLKLDFSSFELPQVLTAGEDPDDLCDPSEPGPRSNFDDPSDAVANALNSNLSATAIVRRIGPSTGSFRLLPSLYHPRLVGSLLCPSGKCPVQVWNSSAGVYQDFFDGGSAFNVEDNPVSVHVDVRIPTTQAYRDLFNGFLNSIESDCEFVCGDPSDALCVSACTLAELARGELRVDVLPLIGAPIFDNPSVVFDDTTPITILPPRFVPPDDPTNTSPLLFEEGFSSGFTSKFASAGVRANAWAALDGNGARARAEGAVPIDLFGLEFDFLALDAGGGVFPNDLSGEFALDLSFVGIVVYSQMLGNATCATDLALRDDLALVNEALKWKLDFFVEKSKESTKDFVVGVVPLTAAFEASGKLGFLVEAGIPVCDANYVDTLFQAHTGPYLEVGMLASAGVGTSKGFSAGIEGDATLVEDTFFARAQVGSLELLTSPTRVSGTLTEDITNVLEGPKGAINLFVGYPCVKFCRKFGIPYPCGVKQCKSRKSIFRFSTYRKEDVLMCESDSAAVEVPGL